MRPLSIRKSEHSTKEKPEKRHVIVKIEAVLKREPHKLHREREERITPSDEPKTIPSEAKAEALLERKVHRFRMMTKAFIKRHVNIVISTGPMRVLPLLRKAREREDQHKQYACQI